MLSKVVHSCWKSLTEVRIPFLTKYEMVWKTKITIICHFCIKWLFWLIFWCLLAVLCCIKVFECVPLVSNINQLDFLNIFASKNEDSQGLGVDYGGFTPSKMTQFYKLRFFPPPNWPFFLKCAINALKMLAIGHYLPTGLRKDLIFKFFPFLKKYFSDIFSFSIFCLFWPFFWPNFLTTLNYWKAVIIYDLTLNFYWRATLFST